MSKRKFESSPLDDQEKIKKTNEDKKQYSLELDVMGEGFIPTTEVIAYMEMIECFITKENYQWSKTQNVKWLSHYEESKNIKTRQELVVFYLKRMFQQQNFTDGVKEVLMLLYPLSDHSLDETMKFVFKTIRTEWKTDENRNKNDEVILNKICRNLLLYQDIYNHLITYNHEGKRIFICLEFNPDKIGQLDVEHVFSEDFITETEDILTW
jgi:hypothetical protein